MSLGIHSEKKDPAGPGLTVDESEIDPPPPFDATSSSASSFVAPPDYGDVPLGINKAYVNPEQSSVVLRFQKAWSLGKWRVEDRNGGELMHVDGKFWSAHRVRSMLSSSFDFLFFPVWKRCFKTPWRDVEAPREKLGLFPLLKKTLADHIPCHQQRSSPQTKTQSTTSVKAPS